MASTDSTIEATIIIRQPSPPPSGRTSVFPIRMRPAYPGHKAAMRADLPAVAASSEWTDGDGVRQPAGEAHAWLPGHNQTLCGLALARSRLLRFPHVRWEYQASDVLTEADRVRHVCRRCAAIAGGRHANRRPWTRHSPRP